MESAARLLGARVTGVLLSGMQDKLNAGDWKRVGVIIILFAFSTIFWMGFEQAATSLNLFARDMTDLSVFGGWLEASSLQAVNGFFIVVLAPVVGAVWYYLGTRQPSDSVKFSIALLFGSAEYFSLMVLGLIAYFCLGYPESDSEIPELEKVGWEWRRAAENQRLAR